MAPVVRCDFYHVCSWCRGCRLAFRPITHKISCRKPAYHRIDTVQCLYWDSTTAWGRNSADGDAVWYWRKTYCCPSYSLLWASDGPRAERDKIQPLCTDACVWNHNQAFNVPGGGPRVVVSTAAFQARVRGSFPGLHGLEETKMFLPHPLLKLSIVGNLCDRKVACSASNLEGLNFETRVWRAVSSQSSHHPQEVLLTQFSLYVHKIGLKPDSFHFFIYCTKWTFLRAYSP